MDCFGGRLFDDLFSSSNVDIAEDDFGALEWKSLTVAAPMPLAPPGRTTTLPLRLSSRVGSGWKRAIVSGLIRADLT
jgi:hypothetical protein